MGDGEGPGVREERSAVEEAETAAQPHMQRHTDSMASDDPHTQIGGHRNAHTQTIGETRALLEQRVAKRACGIFPRNFLPRRLVISLVEEPAFDRMVVGFILANSIFLALDSNRPGFENTRLGNAVFISEIIFSAGAYTLRACAPLFLMIRSPFLFLFCLHFAPVGGRWQPCVLQRVV